MKKILSLPPRQETRQLSPALPLLLAALLALGGPSVASAQSITTFDATATSTNTFPVAINLAGTVAGEFDDGFGQHGFLRAPNGTITTFDPTFCAVGSTSVISSSAINSSGAVIGFCGIPNVGFVRDPTTGAFTEINPPGSTGTQVNSINDSGEVAGSYVDSALPAKTHGFVWSPVSGYTSFDVPGGTFAEDHFGVDIVSINSSGQVAGFYFVSSSVADGFLRNPDNTFTTFPAPVAGDRVQATSMNDSAQITGFYGPGFTTFSGFLQQGATTTSFDVSGQTQTLAENINRYGTIVGSGEIGFNNAVGFVRDPLGTITTFVVPTADNTQPQSVNDLGVIAGIWLGPSPSFTRHGFIAVFTPAEMVSNLITGLQGMNITGLGTSLTDQLQIVETDLAAENGRACIDLGNFASHVKAQTGKKITTGQANQLQSAVASIEAALSCGG
jgi:hypothetical protein